MARFSPSMLIPAAQVPAFSKGNTGSRTGKDIALAAINKMREQHAAGDGAEGKRNFRVSGDKVAFSIRVSNTALVLGQFEEGGVTADVREMTVPSAHFGDALDFYASKIEAGEYDAALSALTERRAASREKASATRSAKKAEQDKEAPKA